MVWHLAQVNVGRTLDDLDSPRLAGFVENLDRINALAEESPGFVWRLQSDAGNATDIQVSDDPRFIVNLSVWETPEVLFDFVYRTAHTKIMAQRREWFERPGLAHQALWWTPAGREPTVEEALAKLAILDRMGPSPAAFTFKARYPAPGPEVGAPDDMKPDPYCSGWA
jgi:hypothetical protein